MFPHRRFLGLAKVGLAVLIHGDEFAPFGARSADAVPDDSLLPIDILLGDVVAGQMAPENSIVQMDEHLPVAADQIFVVGMEVADRLVIDRHSRHSVSR